MRAQTQEPLSLFLPLPPPPPSQTPSQGEGDNCTRAVFQGGGGGFVTPTEKKHSQGPLCFTVKTWTRHKTTETALNNGWRLPAVGGWWSVAVGGWRLLVLGGCPYQKTRGGISRTALHCAGGPSSQG